MPERCVMSTQSSPATSLRTINRFPAAGVLLRVVSYLIYKALSPILPAISGAGSIFLPAFPGRQGNSGTRVSVAAFPFAAWNGAVFLDRFVARDRKKARQRLLDDDPGRGAALAARDLLPDADGHLPEDDGMRVVGLGNGDRDPAVGGLADLDIERHFAQKLDAEPLGFVAGAAMRKDLAAAAAMRAQEIAHVLDDAEHRHVDLCEHVEPLAGVEKGDVLRGRDDDRTGERHLLRHRQLRVAGP